MRKILLILFLATSMGLVAAVHQPAETQHRAYKFWVEFTDKYGAPYNILKPWDFLSGRAIQRRLRFNIPITEADFPVSRKYLSVLTATGLKVNLSSRWMNAALITTTDSGIAQRLYELTFVRKVTLAGVVNKKRGAAEEDPDMVGQADMPSLSESLQKISVKNKVSKNDYNQGYGLGWAQVKQIGADKLHTAGFRGEGIWIAVLDAGFYRANLLECFDSMYTNRHFLGSVDLIDGGSNVYNDDDHGTQVLSCLASNLPGVMVGTAPDASYLLIRTEDAESEMPCEEMQWLVGAEYADSVGVDMISSSLGYTEFDDPGFGHSYTDLDGKTTWITKAANMAWDRGIMIVNSAGNEGDNSWKFIGAPADADGVIAVAAVDEDGDYVGFSSVGPTADKRIKPDLAAMGQRTTVINSNGYYIHSNGTSFSAPVLAGAMACFMQAFPSKNNSERRQLVNLSASQALNPDNLLGYGIPDFGMAMKVGQGEITRPASGNPFFYFPHGDTVYSVMNIRTNLKPVHSYDYVLYNAKGKRMASGTLMNFAELMYAFPFQPSETGLYKLEIRDGDKSWEGQFYFIKNK